MATNPFTPAFGKVPPYMAGLPHRTSTLLSGESTAFLRRAFRRDLGSVGSEEVAEALRVPFQREGRPAPTSAREHLQRAA